MRDVGDREGMRLRGPGLSVASFVRARPSSLRPHLGEMKWGIGMRAARHLQGIYSTISLDRFQQQQRSQMAQPSVRTACPPLPVSIPHPPLPPPPTPLTSHPKLYVQPSRGAMALVRPQCGPHLSTKKQSEAASPGTESCTVSTRRYRLAGGWGGSAAAPAAPAAAPLGPPAEEDDTCRPRLCCRGALRERLSARLIGSAGPSSPAPAAIPT